MEREKFEDSWKNSFDEAEITPSEKVWTNIELNLEKQKGGQLKRRLLFYQMLAAASVVFALGIGGAGLYFNLRSQPVDTNLAMETPQRSLDASPSLRADSERDGQPTTIEEDRTNTEANSRPDIITERREKIDADNKPSRSRKITPSITDNESRNVQQRSEDAAAGLAISHQRDYPQLPDVLSDRKLPSLYTPRRIQLNIPSEQEMVDPVVAMLARLEQREKEVQETEKSKKGKADQGENLWTSIGFAAGSFSNTQSSPSRPAPSTAIAMAAPIVDQETKASGYSYSMGVNMGTKLSERWVFQGGVNYLTHESEYTTNNVVVSNSDFQQQRFHPATTNELVNADAKGLGNKLVSSAPYNVNNSMRYLSIPLQAGYLLVDKTFGLQLNAGVATDLFLQNTVTADTDQLDKSRQSGGASSPYRSVNLSGLLGTELSYRFGPHYRIALNPGIRYPFNTIYKSELGAESTPLSFDVGLRFRYIFH
ncbi:MAG TPA: outer membrane beta-barrel protein [Chryseosolibacter sp.]|nr:outer membrane beta-barrel protein [Chryseosolibacter sp.]